MSIGEILRSPGICANGLLVHRFLGRDCQVPLKLKPIFQQTELTDLSSRSKKTLLNCPVFAKNTKLWQLGLHIFPLEHDNCSKGSCFSWANHSQISNNLLESRKSSDAKWRSTTWDIAGDSDTKTVVIIVAGWGGITKNPIHTSGIHRNHAISTCRIFPQFFGPRERLQLEHFFQIYSSRKLHFWQKKNVIPQRMRSHPPCIFAGLGHQEHVFLLGAGWHNHGEDLSTKALPSHKTKTQGQYQQAHEFPLSMAEILHQLIRVSSLSHYLQGAWGAGFLPSTINSCLLLD